VHAGDTLIVPRLDRFARSVPDARSLADITTGRGARLQIGPTVYDPRDPFGKMFFNILAAFAEFEVDIIRLRTIEGTARARQRGKLKGKQPKLNPQRRAHLLQLDREGKKNPTELFGVSRATIYRELKRAHEVAA
jgi:DNA invertase Pin-like site-specific DNA recombinase